ncbi:hypothetical protein OS175_05590 [Marinicella sp. S1101]|uniref:hypothetical protein n=1 Tax=Marinicella marina TaxID=2996016 RepID=UPI002260E231|nr:hypothetical protein [Marinicella marina]MCX7553343.1 hypothetical protein [Marinicella marina]MDJ1139075.1 hypothetical protein [Marinicella marina]
MNKYLMYAPMAVFGLTAFFLFQYFMHQNEPFAFRDNLVPELIGFCLEGFFWIGLLSYFQKSREMQRKNELWLSLRGSLRSFLSYLDIGFLDQHAEPMPSVVLEKDPKIIQRFINQIESQELDLESMVYLKKTCIHSLGLVRDLVPVAAQLSANHMRWWIAITDSMRHLADSNDRQKLEKNTLILLKNIQEFDALEY